MLSPIKSPMVQCQSALNSVGVMNDQLRIITARLKQMSNNANSPYASKALTAAEILINTVHTHRGGYVVMENGKSATKSARNTNLLWNIIGVLENDFRLIEKATERLRELAGRRTPEENGVLFGTYTDDLHSIEGVIECLEAITKGE